MPEGVLDVYEVSHDDKTTGARNFLRRQCFAGVVLLCFVLQNLVRLPLKLMHQDLSFLFYEFDPRNKDDSLFDILCTTERRRQTGGSYIIRCRDFKDIAEHCAANVRVHLYSHDQLIFKPNVSGNSDGWEKDFNATVSVKVGLKPKPRFGKMFMDAVDRYTFWDDLDPQVKVIVQTKYHALDEFPNRTYHVVEHWYNSFPEDMLASQDIPEFDLPVLQEVSNMKMATVWTNKKQPCPTISLVNNSDVIYDCISERFIISTWYHKYFNAIAVNGNSSVSGVSRNTSLLEMQRLESLLQDPKQGPGRIYYELFWLYDVLVVPAKTALPEKLRWGNVQRAVSQMRSGIPVLLEIYGEVLEDFMTTYNYTCAYKMNHEDGTQKRMKSLKKKSMQSVSRKYWTLDEAVIAMKESHELRRKCQEEGFTIAKDYSPARLIEKELRILGFGGDFDCPR